MTKCSNCGYERQPIDEGFIPPTECPKFRIIHDKAAPLKNEETHVSHGSKQAKGDGREIAKVPTYIFQNILLILLSVPPFVLFVQGIMVLTSLKAPSWWLIPVTTVFIIAGTILGLMSARKIRRMAVPGQSEESLKIAKRVNKYFFGVHAITWMLGLASAVYVPSYAAYRSRGYDAISKNDLKNYLYAFRSTFHPGVRGTCKRVRSQGCPRDPEEMSCRAGLSSEHLRLVTTFGCFYIGDFRWSIG